MVKSGPNIKPKYSARKYEPVIRAAFTLIELLIAIAIIGMMTILATIAFKSAQEQARDARRLADISQIQNALELYRRDEGHYPDNLAFGQALSGSSSSISYLQYVPLAPAVADGHCSESGNAYSYTATANSQSYELNFCLGSPRNDLPAGVLTATPVGVKACEDNSWAPDVFSLCGQVEQTSNCGNTRQVAGGSSCLAPLSCGGGGVPNECGCSANTDAQICATFNAVCGSLEVADNCGQQRTITSCGTCSSGQGCFNNSCHNNLAASYNMVPSGSVLPDLSGSGRDGTIGANITATSSGGLSFAPIDGTGIAITSLNSPDFSIIGTARMTSFSHVWGSLVAFGGVGYTIGSNNTSNFGAASVIGEAGAEIATSTPLNSLQNLFTFAFTHDADGAKKLYLNGSLVGSDSKNWNLSLGYALPMFIGNATSGGGNRNLGSVISDLKFYTSLLSDTEIQDYNNQFASQSYLSDNFSDEPLNATGTVPSGWIAGTGSYKVVANSNPAAFQGSGERYIECVTAGTLSLPSTQAYGTWEFDFYKATTTNYIQIGLANDKASIIGARGYVFSAPASLKYHISREDSWPTGLDFYQTSSSYLQNNNWYRTKITKSYDGTWNAYIKGGTFGNNYVMVHSALNNNTYTTGNYFVLDIDPGDRLANLHIYRGVIQ